MTTDSTAVREASLRNSIVAFLKSNEASLKSFILAKQQPPVGQVREKGPTFSKIGTYTPMDEAALIPGNSIAMFCTRIDRPLEYAIENDKYTDLYGVFVPNSSDASQFLMEVYSVVGTEHKPIKPMLTDLYRWEPIRKKMVSQRVEVSVALNIVSPIIRERCEILQRDIESILEGDKRSIKTMLKYVDILYEATLKHMNTNLDRDVFYTVITRRKFADVERHLRKYLWDYSELVLANLVSIIQKSRTDLQNLQSSSERSAFASTLNVLISFLNEMHPLILKNIRLDPQHVKEDIRVYLNTLIKAYIPATSTSDPLSDHFIFLTDSSICRPESGQLPTKLELLADLFVSPVFLEKQKAVSAFVKDMPTESRTSIHNGLKELLSKIHDTNIAYIRSVRYLVVLLEMPDAAASDLMDVAMKTDVSESRGLLDFLSIGGPAIPPSKLPSSTLKNKPEPLNSTLPSTPAPILQQAAFENPLASTNQSKVLPPLPLEKNPLRRTLAYDDLSKDVNRPSMLVRLSSVPKPTGPREFSRPMNSQNQALLGKEKQLLAVPVDSADQKDLPALPNDRESVEPVGSTDSWEQDFETDKGLPALPEDRGSVDSADPWEQDFEAEKGLPALPKGSVDNADPWEEDIEAEKGLPALPKVQGSVDNADSWEEDIEAEKGLPALPDDRGSIEPVGSTDPWEEDIETEKDIPVLPRNREDFEETPTLQWSSASENQLPALPNSRMNEGMRKSRPLPSLPLAPKDLQKHTDHDSAIDLSFHD